MGVLLDYSGPYVTYKGKKYRVTVSFDTVLLIRKLYEEETLEAGDKIAQSLKMLTRAPVKIWLLSDMERVELLDRIMKEKIQLPLRPQIGTQRKLMDFEADSDYIYASFKQAYGMDLIKERGKLSWKNFCELLDGLPEKTKLKEVMRIRAMDIPEPTKYNQKERQSIMELKAYYALPAKGGGGQRGLDTLFSALERIAEHG